MVRQEDLIWQPYELAKVIKLIEKYVGKKALLQYKEFPKVDMQITWADINKAQKLLGWQPQVSLEEGIKRAVEWTKDNWDWVQKIKV